MINFISRNQELNTFPVPISSISPPSSPSSDRIQYRVALDLGSGTVKMQSAWVDIVSGRIIEIIDVKKVAIPLRDAVEKDPEQCIPEPMFQLLKNSIGELIAEAKKHGEIAGCVGAATEAYRYALNGQDILDRLERELGIPLFKLTQDEEADLGYAALKAEGQIAEGAIVWENGGGSLQISTKIGNSFGHFNLQLGKIPMKNYLIGQVQGKDIHDTDTPNPISKEEAEKAIEWVKGQFKNAPAWLKERTDQDDFIGMSACFTTVMRALGKKEFTKEELRHLLEERLGKTNEELILNRIENPIFMVSDLILLYGVMDELNIEKIRCAEMKGPGSTSGLLVDTQKWPSQLPSRPPKIGHIKV